MEHSLELQKFHYFDEGNTYAGKRPRTPTAACCCATWWSRTRKPPCCAPTPGPRTCASSGAHDKLQKEVPLSEEGLEQALAWLEEQYAAL